MLIIRILKLLQGSEKQNTYQVQAVLDENSVPVRLCNGALGTL